MTSLILGFTVLCIIGQVQHFQSSCKFRHRNFYGIYRIMDQPPSASIPAGLRMLVHGKTNHGAQFLAQEQRPRPTSYYYRGGAIADVYETIPSPRGIAVIGLGAGVVSAYTRPQDVLTFFEIDPDNEKIARSWFTFLDDSQARVSVLPGDGRLTMNQAAKGMTFNIIHVDAFTGDGIPTHLLTLEAMEVYLSRLAKDGIILFHISNRYYDLRAVLKATAAKLNLAGAMNIPDQTQTRSSEISPQCVVLARNPERLQPLIDRNWVALGKNDGLTEAAFWTDDYINILAPLWARLWPQHAKNGKLGLAAAGVDVVR